MNRAETYNYLSQLIASGRVQNLAQEADEAVEQMRKAENRRRLARATAGYYESLSAEEAAEESALADSMHSAASRINFDREH